MPKIDSNEAIGERIEREGLKVIDQKESNGDSIQYTVASLKSQHSGKQRCVTSGRKKFFLVIM